MPLIQLNYRATAARHLVPSPPQPQSPTQNEHTQANKQARTMLNANTHRQVLNPSVVQCFSVSVFQCLKMFKFGSPKSRERVRLALHAPKHKRAQTHCVFKTD